jgi:hypothetical protein
VDEDIRQLESQVSQLKLECKILQRARDQSAVVASKMVKEIERLEDILQSQRKSTDKGSTKALP